MEPPKRGGSMRTTSLELLLSTERVAACHDPYPSQLNCPCT